MKNNKMGRPRKHDYAKIYAMYIKCHKNIYQAAKALGVVRRQVYLAIIAKKNGTL